MTIFIIAVTSLVSIMAFNNGNYFYQLRHWPYAEAQRNEYYRWFTSGLLHADWGHLLFNMLTLFFFGDQVEQWFRYFFGETFGGLAFVAFYVLALGAASSGTYYRHKDNPGFASIGASGAVAAVLFASILLYPTTEIIIFPIPIGIPGFVFGPLYLWYSSSSAKKGQDNIDHLAHFFGAVFGFFFPLIFSPGLLNHFFGSMLAYIGNLMG